MTTAAAVDPAGSRHNESDPKGGRAVLRQGESFKKNPRSIHCHVRPQENRPARLLRPPPSSPASPASASAFASDPDERGYPILFDNQPVGHSEFFHQDFVAALNVVEALMVSPRDFARLLAAMGGVALEHVAKIAVERVEEEEED